MRHSQYSAASGSLPRTALLERRDLVVELLAALVEATIAAGSDFSRNGNADQVLLAVRLRQVCGDFQADSAHAAHPHRLPPP